MSKSIIFLVKSFLDNFIDIWWLLSGHTGCGTVDEDVASDITMTRVPIQSYCYLKIWPTAAKFILFSNLCVSQFNDKLYWQIKWNLEECVALMLYLGPIVITEVPTYSRPSVWLSESCDNHSAIQAPKSYCYLDRVNRTANERAITVSGRSAIMYSSARKTDTKFRSILFLIFFLLQKSVVQKWSRRLICCQIFSQMMLGNDDD